MLIISGVKSNGEFDIGFDAILAIIGTWEGSL